MVAALFFGIISPSMLSDGMFMDGVTYAVISKNLAHGMGSFWDLHYTSTLFPHFHEHPPLVFGIQSLLFTLLGDSILVERIYSLMTFIITAILIHVTWKTILGREHGAQGWLPLLLWTMVPLVTWAAANNILENTMMIFTGLSVLFILKSLSAHRFLNLSTAGLMLFLAWMSKGFVGLFPLSLPFWIYLFKPMGPYRRGIWDTLILIMATLVPFLIMFLLIPGSWQSLHAYIDKQVVASLVNAVTVESRFYILGRLMYELLPGLLLMLVLYIASRKYRPLPANRKWSYLFLSLGLSGVLPILISLKQSRFYILAAIPFFSIALALMILPRVNYLVDRLARRKRFSVIFKYTAITFFIVSIFMTIIHYDKIGRDREMLEDIYVLREIIPQGSTISVTADLWHDWLLHAYFQRYGEISLDADTNPARPFLLVDQGSGVDLPLQYEKYPLSLQKYELYKRSSLGP